MPGQVVICRAALAGGMILVVASLVGCRGGDRPKTIPISGRVTFNGQPPGENGRLHFQPTQVASGYSRRPAGGTFTAEGSYRVMSWEPDDGLVPGHYTVSLMPADPNDTKIPPRYREGGTSGLEVEVPVDQGPIEFDIEVSTK
ncbi:MAG: hypothetical protein AB7G28_08800 [Pirellulales bacterium]